MCVATSRHAALAPQRVRARWSSSSSNSNVTSDTAAATGGGIRKSTSHITASTTGTELPADVVALTDGEYARLASDAIDTINDQLDAFFEDNRLDGDVDEDSGVMEVTTTHGVYVINKQPPTKQIWLSSPISGPKRFDFHDGHWVSLRDGQRLLQLLQDEINDIYGGGFEWE